MGYLFSGPQDKERKDRIKTDTTCGNKHDRRLYAVKNSVEAAIKILSQQLAELNTCAPDINATESACVYVVKRKLKKLNEILATLDALNLLELDNTEQYVATCATDASKVYAAWQQTKKTKSRYGYIISSVVAVTGGVWVSLGLAATSTGVGLPVGITLLVIALLCAAVNYAYNRYIESNGNKQYAIINEAYKIEMSTDSDIPFDALCSELLPELKSNDNACLVLNNVCDNNAQPCALDAHPEISNRNIDISELL